MDPELELAVDADIRRARTLPGRFYGDAGLFDAARDRVFARSWQLVADLGALRVPGQVHPFTLLEGLLDEPLLLTRDGEDRLHCLSNVCTHRANVVCEGPGVEKTLRCRYHGRSFHLDGRFRSTPGFEGAEGFPGAADDLPRVPHGTFGPLVFASLRPASPLEELLRDASARVSWMRLAELTFDPARSRDYLVRAHWALYVENYLEGFHVPFVHASLAAALDAAAYRTELFPRSTLQVGIAAPGEECFDLPDASPDRGQRVAAYYFWLFPATMLNFYPWGLSANVVLPLAPDRTRVRFLTWVGDPARLERGAGAGLDRVEREDEAVVESVQRGVRSRLYDRGRYSPTHERGVHHFHRLLAAALSG